MSKHKKIFFIICINVIFILIFGVILNIQQNNYALDIDRLNNQNTNLKTEINKLEKANKHLEKERYALFDSIAYINNSLDSLIKVKQKIIIKYEKINQEIDNYNSSDIIKYWNGFFTKYN